MAETGVYILTGFQRLSRQKIRAISRVGFAFLVVVTVVVVAGVATYSGTFSKSQGPVKSSSMVACIGCTTIKATSITSALSAAQTCSSAQTPSAIGLLFGAAHAGVSSPAIICVQFFYYASSTLTLNLSSLISVNGFHPPVQNGSITYQNMLFNGGANFTINTNQSELVLGGPDGLNEGAMVAFQITAKAGASGTYGIDFKADYMLDPTEPVGCGEYGELLAGTGQPNYFANYEGGCITYGVSTTNSSQTETAISSLHTISNYSYPLLSGDLYFRVAGVANSTQ